ncbi:MAG: TIGR04086 family membrane protein [Clostridia bacterium]|nr:TIGR04086 family membrane protein [Clostridia bacterium]
MFKSSSLLKGVLSSLAFSLVCVLIFAMLSAIFSFGEKVILPVNTIIKILAVFIGTVISVSGEKGLLKGALTGALIVVLNYLLFSLIGGSLTFTLRFLWEILLGLVIGALSGIIAVNVKKKA